MSCLFKNCFHSYQHRITSVHERMHQDHLLLETILNPSSLRPPWIHFADIVPIF